MLPGFKDYDFGLPFNTPIGAFYDSQSASYDNAPSIATKTLVLLDSAKNNGLNATLLADMDSNKDGKLSGGELLNLKAWADTNENGRAETGEITALSQRSIGEILAGDYGFYTRGSSFKDGTALSPPTVGGGTPPTNTPPGVPASGFDDLRAKDESYDRGIYTYTWANLVKISKDQQYLIGTNGDDAFDAGYYSDYASDFDLGLLKNFLGGDGDDAVGGSDRADTIWGGHGNDFLLGYAGDDKLYGEEGGDEMSGQDGVDHMDGGIGGDTLFGGVGNDVLNGGDGNDVLVGFTASNDTKQTLDADKGESDDDTLDGGAGDDLLLGATGTDRLFGGLDADDLLGGDGNDRLSGEAGNDRLFGQTGDDILWGGAGEDILLGFTGADESKQTLDADKGESDDDILYGGEGVDNLYGDLGKDTLDGGDSDDLLSGWDGDDKLFGGAGNDQLQGGVGVDYLLGEAGDDRLFGQVGNDKLWGGGGNDILLGFTATNETKQSLDTGESDNDLVYGGDGQDLLMGGLGDDYLHGETGDDELQAGAGNDKLYGEAGADRLFGQVGNDVLYGGDGDDILVGFTASNEAKKTLNINETDNDWLYGGSGKDYLLGGVGGDYLDGGAGADDMEGGAGDDVYIVNSVNDSILEGDNAGKDIVISSANYLLNKNIEELRLLDDLDIHGTGNALDNKIIGNNRNNILDGVTGRDTMMGEKGNDTYYVDNAGDQVIEQAGEGADRVQSSISHTLGANVEDLVLLDFSKPEQGQVDGVEVLVYGYPKMNELDYSQGDAVDGYEGTCALTAISNLLAQADRPISEQKVVTLAINNNWALKEANRPAYELGGSTPWQQQAILNYYGIRNDLLPGYNAQGLANLVMSGRGVIVAVNAGKLWGETAYVGDGKVNHAITVTGVVYNKSDNGGDGALKGFYIADSGRHKVSDMTRFVGIEQFKAAANVGAAYAIYTLEPLKLWDEDLNGIGNDSGNVIIGNRGDNRLSGKGGNDKLSGGAGDDTLSGDSGADTLIGGEGDDTYVVDNVADSVVENAGEGADSVQSGVTYTLAGNVENLTLTGTAAINGTGNALVNVLTGNSAANLLNGGFGNDTLIGGTGNDTYVVNGALDAIIENASGGADLVQSSVTYTLPGNVENLILTGTAALNGVGNTSPNALTGNGAANKLEGGVGVDTVDGGIGNDILDGGAGADRLTGGGGLDVFRFTTSPVANMDTITDFSVNDDTIQLDNAIFTQLTATGVLNASLFVKAAVALDMTDYVLYNAATGAVIYDADGNGVGAGLQIAQLGVNLTLSNADFVVI